MPSFLRHLARTLRQVKRADGFVTGALLADRSLAFWTMTVWRDQADMRGYMAGGAHRDAMPFLMDWCDEASVVHWHEGGKVPPDWHECDARMRAEGRPSKVRQATRAHRDLAYRTPRLWSALPIGRSITRDLHARPRPR